MYSVFADRVLEQGGVVFGVAFEEGLQVAHRAVRTKDELTDTRTSKYVQSNIGQTYKDADKLLKIGRRVLFSGTPCQIAGLYGYLGGDPERLITCDLVCHGVASPLVFEKYLENLNDNVESKIVGFNFRHEGYNRAVVMENGRVQQLRGGDDNYMRAFMLGYSLRKSCSRCLYAKLPRYGDLTLGDFWGLGNTIEFDQDIKDGVSLLLVNSQRGREFFEGCVDRLLCVPRPLGEAVAGNPHLQRPSLEHLQRGQFFEDVHRLSYKELSRKYLRNRITPRRIANKLKYESGRVFRKSRAILVSLHNMIIKRK